MAEQVYYVDENDQPTGDVREKLAAHGLDTKLHAAFSCYIFNDKGQFLVTQRAHSKKVWPSVWTNSVCGHPAPAENREDAVRRRAKYELGMELQDLQLVVPDYRYKTPPYNGIIENEYCPVFVAIVKTESQLNPDEVEDYKWVDWQWYVNNLSNDPKDYSVFAEKAPKELDETMPHWSWWCKDQLQYLQQSKSFEDFISNKQQKGVVRSEK